LTTTTFRTKFTNTNNTPIKMKSILSLTLISALSLTSSAAAINKVRQAPGTTYSYTVTTVESNGVTSTFTSDPNGIVSASFSPSNDDFLTSASIYNPANNAQCTLRDQWGNQVRAFGGPDQGVDSVELVEADGIQVFSLYCAPV
jgi:WD40 repeat protein